MSFHTETPGFRLPVLLSIQPRRFSAQSEHTQTHESPGLPERGLGAKNANGLRASHIRQDISGNIFLTGLNPNLSMSAGFMPYASGLWQATQGLPQSATAELRATGAGPLYATAGARTRTRSARRTHTAEPRRTA